MQLEFFLNGDPSTPLSVSPARLINGGYSGRSAADVAAHVAELKVLGIPAPERTPCFFPKTPGMIDQEPHVMALDTDCSGEAEYVTVQHNGRLYLTCGSDVFDKTVEPLGTAKSKHMYSNKIAKSVWLLDDVKNHFDSLVLRSWHGEGRKRLYQEGLLANILPPEEMLRYLKEYRNEEPRNDFIMYSGTFPAMQEGMPFTECFDVELSDPVLGRSISCRYTISILS